MIKFKWLFPFIPLWVLATPIPSDVPTRYLVVFSSLAMMVAGLAIVQPWRPDPPRKNPQS